MNYIWDEELHLWVQQLQARAVPPRFGANLDAAPPHRCWLRKNNDGTFTAVVFGWGGWPTSEVDYWEQECLYVQIAPQKALVFRKNGDGWYTAFRIISTKKEVY